MYIFSLAWRYATCRLVNYVAMLAVALCVLVQVVVMSVLDGVLEDLQKRVQDLGEQITVVMPGGGISQKVYGEAAKGISALPGVKGVSPALESYAGLSFSGSTRPVIIRGIDLESECKHGGLPRFVKDLPVPSWLPPDFKSLPQGRDGIIVGSELARHMRLSPGDEVALEAIRPGEVKEGEDKLVRRKFIVSTRFESGISHYDEYYVYIPLSAAQDMLQSIDRPRDSVGLASVWLADPQAAAGMKDSVVAAADEATGKTGYVSAQTWQEAWRGWFEAVAHENALQEVVMAFISLASACCIFAILSTLAANRIRDVGILRSIGASRFRVAMVFVLTGLVIGAVGAVAGAVGGWHLAPHVDALWEVITGEPLYPPHLFGIKGLPILLSFFKAAAYAGAAVLLAVVASLPAALWAGRVQPLEALRHE